MESITSEISDNLEKVCDSLPDVIIIIDKEGSIVYSNKRIEDVFGYAKNEVYGKKVEELLPEAKRGKHVSEREIYQENPSLRPMGTDIDLEAQKKDSSTFPVDIALSPIELDNMYFLAAIRDLTHHEVIEKKYQSLLETAPDPVFIADAETGKIIDVNDSGIEVLGYEKDEIIGMDQTQLHPDGKHEKYKDLFKKHIEKGGTFSRLSDDSYVYLETKNKDRIPVEINANVVNLDDRQLIIGIFRNITKRLEYEEKLKEKIDRLKEFAGIVSHDLRTPLNIAKTHTEFLENKYEEDKDIEKIHDSIERTEEIIDNLLTLVKEESIDIERVNIQNIAKDCWDNIKTKNGDISVEEIEIIGDREKLKNLFENLFRNSIKYGGKDIDIYVGKLEDGFYIEDNGPGIQEDKRDKVLKKGYSSSNEGAGLGLYIVKKIVEAHNWEINIKENEYGGSRFEITGVKIYSK